jgi:cysteine desulfurase family protein (TIGR01976 family)
VTLSTAEIRANFPALSRQHRGFPVAYFDGPGGTQVPTVVVEAMTDYLYRHNANTHWRYPSSEETDAIIAASREAVADFLNATPAEIVFGANMTTLTFHLGRALGRGWGSGDEIVVTELDHHANVAPWTALERERGITIRTVPLILATGQLDWAALERALSSRTRLLAIGAASNALGTVSDIARAIRLARQAGALTFVDAVHYAPHHAVDVRTLDCDFLACSSYKFYGPHMGVLYGRRAQLQALDAPKLAPAPDSAPERMETGTLNHEGIAGAGAAVDFLASLSQGRTRRERLITTLNALHGRGQKLLERVWEGLSRTAGVKLYGPRPSEPRTPTVAFTVKGRTADEVASALAERGVFVSSGDFYATTVVARLGLADQGLVRAGCACYTTEEEIDRLLEGVRSVTRSTVPAPA